MSEQNVKSETFFAYAVGVVGAVYDAVMRDGHIAAAGRQGLDELAHALKAFPDSIQEREYGTIFNPYPSDAIKDREKHAESSGEAATPGKIAAGAGRDQDNDLGRDDGPQGPDRGRGR